MVSSADLVSSFYAVWSEEQRASHERAARAVATIGQEAIRLAGSRADSATPLTEYSLQTWIREKFAAGGLEAGAFGTAGKEPRKAVESWAGLKRDDVTNGYVIDISIANALSVTLGSTQGENNVTVDDVTGEQFDGWVRPEAMTRPG